MYRSVLVPLDGSEFAEQALPWAASIARRVRGRLDLVRVHVLYALKDPTATWAPFNPVLESECKEDEQLYLDATAAWLEGMMGVEVTSTLLHGLTADGVLERGREVKADLIVMTTHGLGPVGRFFLGSVADELIRRGEAPVLLVPRRRPPPRLIPAPEARRVVIPLDGSTLAEQALDAATGLARVMESRCTLLRVIEPAASSAETHAEANNYLKAMSQRVLAPGLEVETRVLVASRPADAILEEAGKEPDSLVAMATHGRGGATRLLLGSVADQVIRAARVPVLVYRPPQPRQEREL
jgi:nucleotide-binding universal stress UspA family protein